MMLQLVFGVLRRRTNAVLNSATNQLRKRNDREQHGLTKARSIVMKLARKSARHASPSQLSFLFAEAAPLVQETEARVRERSVQPPALVLAKPAKRSAPPKRVMKQPPSVLGHEDRRLTVEEAAQVLCVSVKTLEAWRRLGKGPMFVKLGRAVRYTMRDLDQFTRERTVRNSAEGRLLDAQR
ncbi:MAG: helix-turn-helix domain-containing protein [Hyphomonadaceae bacterium]